MKEQKRYIRKLAALSVFFIFVFMVIALLQYKREDDSSMLPEQLEFYFNEGWTMAAIDAGEVSGAGSQDYEKIQSLFQNAAGEEKRQELTLPYANQGRPGEAVILKNTLMQEYAGLTMSFDSKTAYVHVFLDGKMVYHYGQEDMLESKKMPESMENVVALPNSIEDGEIWVVLEPMDADQAVSIGDVKIESRDKVVIGVVVNNVADICCCMLIIIMAVILFVLAMIRKYTHQPSRGELFLGLAELAAGVYCFINTDTLSIFYDVQEAYEMQEYLVLLLLTFLALYFERNLHGIYPRRFSILLWGVCINAVVQILLHWFGVRRLEGMQNLSAAVMGFICVFAVVSLLQLGRKNYFSLLSAFSMLVLLCGEIANVMLNVVVKGDYGYTASQYSMAVFGVVMAAIHTLQLSKEYRANAEENAKLLQEKVNVAQQQNVQLALAKEDADAARQEALAANEAKGKFLAHMSHEIRTPINAVLGMDEMILRESKEPGIKEYAMDIYTAGQTLLSLINDILDFSKIESGKMEIVPTEYDVSSMIHDLVNMATQRAKDKDICLKVEVDHEIPSRLYGDDVRIRQVLTNMLTNAVKYTHEGTVWLRVSYCKKEDVAVLDFEVEDTGIGIKEEDLPKLFAEFERIEEERNRNIEGTGLGMNITIQLLALLGSKLHVESTYGKGSKFFFRLEQEIVDETPIGDFESRVRQLAENYSYSTKFCAPDAKVLVVDDNAVNRKVLRSLLKDTQIQITDADRGAQCLELVQKEHFDLIFLDHMMPEMDGIETLRHMKELSDYPCKDTPVIMLTANAVTGAKEKYLAEGFDGFLSKPIALEKLENMLKTMLPAGLLREAVRDTDAGTGQDELDQPGNHTDVAGDFLEELPQVDGLDWQYAWMHLPDLELLEFTVKEFYAQIESAAEQLEQFYRQLAGFQSVENQEQAVDENPLGQYRIQVHAMKSLAATVGLMSLSGVAKLLEYAARDGKLDTILSITPAFLEEWCSYQEKLRGVFDIGTEKKKEVTDYSIIRALVEMLRLSMQEMDIDQADQLINQIREYEYPDEIRQNIQKLADAVTNLDSEETDRLAGMLMQQMER